MFQAFRFFDEDDDGSITGEEVKRVMAKLGENLSEDEINEMVKEADLDGDGRIEFSGSHLFIFYLNHEDFLRQVVSSFLKYYQGKN